MDWWTDLWLNEGFATWAEYHAVNQFHPEFDIWRDFQVGQLPGNLRNHYGIPYRSFLA